jgi:hypothetical protein
MQAAVIVIISISFIIFRISYPAFGSLLPALRQAEIVGGNAYQSLKW